MADSLRDALERLAATWEAMDMPGLAAPSNQQWADGVDCGYDQAAADLRLLLAAHPVEPASTCTCDPGPEGQHRYWCDLEYGPVDEPVDEAADTPEGSVK